MRGRIPKDPYLKNENPIQYSRVRHQYSLVHLIIA